MAVKVAHDMNVFPVLAQATSPVPLKELAAAKPADPLLVGQFLSLMMGSCGRPVRSNPTNGIPFRAHDAAFGCQWICG